MSTTTKNLGLVKPQLTDVADITAMNPNWDKIDALTAKDVKALSEIATYYNSTSGLNLDVATDSLMLIDKALSKNCPLSKGSDFLFVLQLFLGSPSANTSRTQIAFPYGASTNKGIAIRTCYNGTWGQWFKVYGGTSEVDTAHNLSIPTLMGGFGIPANSDLNSYITVGNYYCSSDSDVMTLTNCPVENSFVLSVSYANGNGYYLAQELTSYLNGVKYYRNYNTGTKQWSQWNNSYNTSNKPTPSEIGALPTSGGTVGDLTVSSQNLKPLKVVNSVADTCYTHYSGVHGALGFLGFSEVDTPAFLNAAGNEIRQLYHTGNKPRGTYTGNGDTTKAREFNLGGVGDMLLIYGPNGSAIVTPRNAFICNSNGVTGTTTGHVYFRGGVFHLGKAHDNLNVTGDTYYYQVI